MSEPASSYTVPQDTDLDAGNIMRRILVALAAIFDTKLTPVKIALYHELLSDLDIEAVRVAATDHMKYGESFPLPVDLRRRVEGNLASGAADN